MMITMSKEVIQNTVPTAPQLSRYTSGAVLPPIEVIEFRPGGGRGRPKAGHEKIVTSSIEDVRRILGTGKWKHYHKIVVRFVDDCHNYEAVVERIFEKTMLVIDGIGIVASAY
jgi:hypothetical protein